MNPQSVTTQEQLDQILQSDPNAINEGRIKIGDSTQKDNVNSYILSKLQQNEQATTQKNDKGWLGDIINSSLTNLNALPRQIAGTLETGDYQHYLSPSEKLKTAMDLAADPNNAFADITLKPLLKTASMPLAFIPGVGGIVSGAANAIGNQQGAFDPLNAVEGGVIGGVTQGVGNIAGQAIGKVASPILSKIFAGGADAATAALPEIAGEAAQGSIAGATPGVAGAASTITNPITAGEIAAAGQGGTTAAENGATELNSSMLDMLNGLKQNNGGSVLPPETYSELNPNPNIIPKESIPFGNTEPLPKIVNTGDPVMDSIANARAMPNGPEKSSLLQSLSDFYDKNASSTTAPEATTSTTTTPSANQFTVPNANGDNVIFNKGGAVDQAQQLQDVVTNAKSTYNPNQLKALESEYKAQGFTAQPGSSNPIAQLQHSIASTENLKDFFKIPDSPDAVFQIGQAAKALKDKAIQEVSATGQFNTPASELLNAPSIDEIAKTLQVDPSVVQDATTSIIKKASPDIATKIGSSDLSQIDITPSEASSLKSSLYKAYQSAEGNTDLGSKITRALYENLQSMENNIPGVADLNKTIASIGGNAPGILNAYNGGGSGITDLITNRGLALKNIIGNVGGKVNGAMGDLQANLGLGGKIPTPAITSPIIRAMMNGTTGVINANQSGPNGLLSNMTGLPSTSLPGTNSVNTVNTDTAFKQAMETPLGKNITLAAASAGKDPYQALQDYNNYQLSQGKPAPFYLPSAGQAQQSIQASNIVKNLENLKEMVMNNPSSVGPVGGAVADTLGVIPGIGGKITATRDALNAVPSQVASFVGSVDPKLAAELKTTNNPSVIIKAINAAQQMIIQQVGKSQQTQQNPTGTYQNFQ